MRKYTGLVPLRPYAYLLGGRREVPTYVPDIGMYLIHETRSTQPVHDARLPNTCFHMLSFSFSGPYRMYGKIAHAAPLFTARASHFPTQTSNNMAGEKFPAIEGGGSLILAWQVRNKKVLVVGGGEVCRTRRPHALPMTHTF